MPSATILNSSARPCSPGSMPSRTSCGAPSIQPEAEDPGREPGGKASPAAGWAGEAGRVL